MWTCWEELWAAYLAPLETEQGFAGWVTTQGIHSMLLIITQAINDLPFVTKREQGVNVRLVRCPEAAVSGR